VPYRGGGESLADFLAGVHQIHVDPNTFPHIASGKGKLLAVQATGVRVQAQGGPAVLSIYVDVTERLAAEEAADNVVVNAEAAAEFAV
jgi:hypothetical protein